MPAAPAGGPAAGPEPAEVSPPPHRAEPDHALAPPGYHIYRPSSATKGSRNGNADGRANGTGSRPNPGDQ
jgi:hypothetical protein